MYYEYEMLLLYYSITIIMWIIVQEYLPISIDKVL